MFQNDHFKKIKWLVFLTYCLIFSFKRASLNGIILLYLDLWCFDSCFVWWTFWTLLPFTNLINIFIKTLFCLIFNFNTGWVHRGVKIFISNYIVTFLLVSVNKKQTNKIVIFIDPALWPQNTPSVPMKNHKGRELDLRSKGLPWQCLLYHICMLWNYKCTKWGTEIKFFM